MRPSAPARAAAPRARRAATADVAIVGGGIAGCAAAWFLANEGLDVLLLERDALASAASGAAAGMLAPVAEGVPGSPLLALGLAALARFPALCDELRAASGVDPELERSGLLRAAESPDAARALAARADALRAAGVAVEWLDAAAARALEPALAPHVEGAIWSGGDAHVRPPLLARAFARGAERRGARIALGVDVRGLLAEGGRICGVRAEGAIAGDVAAGAVVVCAGAWSRALEGWMEAALPEARGADGAARAAPPPVEPVRGQILALGAPLPRSRAIVWGEGGLYLVPKRDGSLVVGATEERVGFDARVTAAGVAALLEGARRLVPALGEAEVLRCWAGLRPASPDGLPSIGALRGVEGLVVAYGHHRNGVLLAPTTGELVRDLVLGKAGAAEAAPFDPARFAGPPAPQRR